jgi:hypothetical protein
MDLHYQFSAGEAQALRFGNERKEPEPFVVVKVDEVVWLFEGNQ